MDQSQSFAKVIVFGNEINAGVHRFPVNTDGPCAHPVADWVLILDVRGDGKVLARGEPPLSLRERVVEPPCRATWGGGPVTVEFEAITDGGDRVLSVSFRDLAAGPRSTAGATVEAVA